MIETKQADVVIVGAGMGGVSAAIWGHRLELSCLLLEQGNQIGGQLHLMHNVIPDYPGILCNNGGEFSEHLSTQLDRLDIVPQLRGTVQDVDVTGRRVLVNREWISCKALVVATGLRRRRLAVSGADAFLGKGVSMTFSGQREMFRGRRSCIVGGGDGAFENALMMSEICPRVVLVYRGAAPRARTSFQEQVKANPSIELRLHSEVVALEGTDWVEAVEVQGPSERERLDVEAVLVKIGMETQIDWLKSAALETKNKYLQVNHEQRTSAPWIWAVGDVCTPVDPSLSVAAGQACIAMRSIERFLRSV